MPCYSGDSLDEIADRDKKKVERLEAMLCAVLTRLNNDLQLLDVLERIDYTKAGLKQTDIVSWWVDHQLADALRVAKL